MHRRKPTETKKDLYKKKKNNKSGGKIAEIYDLQMKGKNRYMKINQPLFNTSNRLNVNGTKSVSKFSNPLLNRFDFDGEEDYEPKQFVFDFIEEIPKSLVNNNNDKKIKTSQINKPRSITRVDKYNLVSKTEKAIVSAREQQHLSRLDKSNITIKKEPIVEKKLFKKENNNSPKLNSNINESKEFVFNFIENIPKSINKEKSEKILDSENNNDKIRSSKLTSPNSEIDEKKVDLVIELIEKTLRELPVKNDFIEKIDSTTQYDISPVIEEKKLEYFKEKKIQINKSTDDNVDIENLTQKPIKTSMTSEALEAENERKLKSACTQTKKDLRLDLISDRLQYTETASGYVNTLIEDVQKIFEDDTQERKNSYDENSSPKFSTNKEQSNSNESSFTNSLGLALEGKHGINMAIIKGRSSDDEKIEYESNELSSSSSSSLNKEQILMKKNFQNLEELISQTMLSDENDSHYLMIAKLNRLKVLMELSMKLIGRTFADISHEERYNLELEANRFHTTFPLPGEESLIEEINQKGEKQIRMPIKILQLDGITKIDINNFYQIEPSEFLTLYTKKLFNHAYNSTGLKFDNVTVAIPASYGTYQREAIKSSLNKASDRDDVQILTRSVAASVILNNKRNVDSAKKLNELSNHQYMPETYKLVFDMTEGSMDASVIRCKDSKDFHAISNVGDTSFGIHDVDERILAHIINEKSRRSRVKRKNISLLDSGGSAYDLETVNAYANLIKNIKQNICENGAVTVDLAYIDESSNREHLQYSSNSQNELFLDKRIIHDMLCKDIYDWALAHIEKAINQADVNDKDVDEIIIIGEPYKMPGFFEYLERVYPYKSISYVKEDDLAVGASIVGRKLKQKQIKITEVLCRSIGIGLYTGVITYLLFRNASLPVVGGCVYSTLVDDQESMVLDIYEGERPHIKFSRYLGEVTVYDLPKGRAGTVKCEVYLKMNHEGLLEVKALDLTTGTVLRAILDANPDHLNNSDVNNDTEFELNPIEAERYKKLDYDLVYALEKLDEHLEDLNNKYRPHPYSRFILDKIFDTKEWVFKNRRTITLDECVGIRTAINRFLKNIESVS